VRVQAWIGENRRSFGSLTIAQELSRWRKRSGLRRSLCPLADPRFRLLAIRTASPSRRWCPCHRTAARTWVGGQITRASRRSSRSGCTPIPRPGRGREPRGSNSPTIRSRGRPIMRVAFAPPPSRPARSLAVNRACSPAFSRATAVALMRRRLSTLECSLPSHDS
jgi:hypothetical protein